MRGLENNVFFLEQFIDPGPKKKYPVEFTHLTPARPMSFCSFILHDAIDMPSVLRNQPVKYMEMYRERNSNVLCTVVFDGQFDLDAFRARLREQLKYDACITTGSVNKYMDDCFIVKTIKRHRGSKQYKCYKGLALHLDEQRQKFDELVGTQSEGYDWTQFLADDIRNQMLEGRSSAGGMTDD